jgi:hypothetical protein
VTQAAAIAAKFAEGLRHALTADEWAEMRRRNAAQTNPAICHSHDFCDANLVMDAAFKAVTGNSIGEREEAGNGGMSDAELELWSDAWTIAKARHLTAIDVDPEPRVTVDSNDRATVWL